MWYIGKLARKYKLQWKTVDTKVLHNYRQNVTLAHDVTLVQTKKHYTFYWKSKRDISPITKHCCPAIIHGHPIKLKWICILLIAMHRVKSPKLNTPFCDGAGSILNIKQEELPHL